MTVFFDVDGVIIDGWHADPERRKPWDATLEQDLGIGRDAFQRAFFKPPRHDAESLMIQCIKGERDLKDALAEVLPALGYRESIDRFVAYWFEKDSNINDDVLKIVKRLKSSGAFELYLATGQEHRRAEYLWNELGLKHLFNDIFYSARLGVLKNQPEFFTRINTALAIGPVDRPLFFDDTDSVVTVARESGWDAYVFNGVEDLAGNARLRDLLGA